MVSNRIVMTPDAEADLTELRDYIRDVLLAPDTARSYLRTVRAEIDGLASMPARYPLVENEPWHSRGIRKLLVKNSIVYFRIDEAAAAVYILNVIYARRDQLQALAEMNMD